MEALAISYSNGIRCPLRVFRRHNAKSFHRPNKVPIFFCLLFLCYSFATVIFCPFQLFSSIFPFSFPFFSFPFFSFSFFSFPFPFFSFPFPFPLSLLFTPPPPLSLFSRPEFQMTVIQQVATWFDQPHLVVEMFVNFDMDTQFVSNWNIFHNVVGALCSIAKRTSLSTSSWDYKESSAEGIQSSVTSKECNLLGSCNFFTTVFLSLFL